MITIRKRIKGFEDYSVSNYGEVVSYKNINNPRIMKTQYNGKGYQSVGLACNNKTKRFLVHRLVANAFISNIESKSTVNHKNGIKLDNSATNLEWMTQAENVSHYFEGFKNKYIVQRNKNFDIIAVWNNVKDAFGCGFTCNFEGCCDKGFLWSNGVSDSKLNCSHFIDMRALV